MALLPARNILDGTALPVTSQMKAALGGLRDFLADLLGTDSSDPDAARTALGAAKAGVDDTITDLDALATVPDVVADAISAAIPAAASETVAGKIRNSTSSENAEGTLQGVAVDPLGIREAFNSTGLAPVFACRAWACIDGQGTPSIYASGNISSIGDNGLSDYTFNFTTPMPDKKYAYGGSAGFTSSVVQNLWVSPPGGVNYADWKGTSFIRLVASYQNVTRSNDPVDFSMYIFR